MNVKKLFFVFTLLSAVIYGCTKEGPTGPAGADGADGADGQDGTANVIYSSWTYFSSSDWSELTNDYGKYVRIYSTTSDDITQSVIDSGLVMVYVKFVGATSPMPLPLSMCITKSSLQHLNFRLSTSTLKIVFFDIEDNDDPGTFSGTNSYRYIIIPGGVQATLTKSLRREEIDYNQMDYSELCKLLNIPE